MQARELSSGISIAIVHYTRKTHTTKGVRMFTALNQSYRSLSMDKVLSMKNKENTVHMLIRIFRFIIFMPGNFFGQQSFKNASSELLSFVFDRIETYWIIKSTTYARALSLIGAAFLYIGLGIYGIVSLAEMLQFIMPVTIAWSISIFCACLAAYNEWIDSIVANESSFKEGKETVKEEDSILLKAMSILHTYSGGLFFHVTTFLSSIQCYMRNLITFSGFLAGRVDPATAYTIASTIGLGGGLLEFCTNMINLEKYRYQTMKAKYQETIKYKLDGLGSIDSNSTGIQALRSINVDDAVIAKITKSINNALKMKILNGNELLTFNVMTTKTSDHVYIKCVNISLQEHSEPSNESPKSNTSYIHSFYLIPCVVAGSCLYAAGDFGIIFRALTLGASYLGLNPTAVFYIAVSSAVLTVAYQASIWAFNFLFLFGDSHANELSTLKNALYCSKETRSMLLTIRQMTVSFIDVLRTYVFGYGMIGLCANISNLASGCLKAESQAGTDLPSVAAVHDDLSSGCSPVNS